MKQYDVVIIGSGLGGLSSAVMLAREGLSVCVLERQRTVGGCLQTFRRGPHAFDTGVHYVGSLADGCILNQYFRYLGVMDKLRLHRLDDAGFDRIHLCDGSEYRHAASFERFEETLAASFPDEREGIRQISREIQRVGALISPEILRSGRLSAGGLEYMGISAAERIDAAVKHPNLRAALAGTAVLYGGQRNRTSFYEYAMINHSNIEGAYSFIGGSQQLADALQAELERLGGEIHLSAEVTSIHLEGRRAEWLETSAGERYSFKHLISSIHPVQTYHLLDNNRVIRPAFFSRLKSLENSYGVFTLYLVFKPQTVRYANCNHYLYTVPDVWATEEHYRGAKLPVALFSMQASGEEYASVGTVLVPMYGGDLAAWKDTTVGHRGADYEAFKEAYAARLLQLVESHFPQIRGAVERYYTATPLTYRDYTLTPEGSAYGIVKDYHQPIVNHLPARTRIENLLLTGQSLNVHGLLGVAVSSAVTCSELLGTEYLAKKIGDA